MKKTFEAGNITITHRICKSSTVKLFHDYQGICNARRTDRIDDMMEDRVKHVLTLMGLAFLSQRPVRISLINCAQ